MYEKDAGRQRKACLMLSLLLLFAFGAATICAAQIPDTFSNLQVLPKDISKRDLIQTMRGFAMGLGVRCEHCHAGEAGMPLSTFDFAADTKPTKKTARIMMQMVQAINADHLGRIAGRTASSLTVKCVTCHHGQRTPRLLEDVLLETTATSGIDAALVKYEKLREQYYGGFTYDFSERVLINTAQLAFEKDQSDRAVRFLELNLKYYPKSWQTHYVLGEAFNAQNQKEKAIAQFKKSLELNPDNRRAQARLDMLSKN